MRERKRRDENVGRKSDRWTADDDAELQRLRDAGGTISEIATRMQRTSNGVAERLKSLRRNVRKSVS